MRKLLALVAFVVLAYCLFELLKIPLQGTSFFEHLLTTRNERETFLGAIAIGCFLILFLLAAMGVKVLHEETSLEDMRKRLGKEIRWIEKREDRHKIALSIKADLEALEPRVEALLSTSNGLPVTLRRIDDLLVSAKTRLKNIPTLSGGLDIAETIEAQVADARSVSLRIIKLEGAFASVPRTADEVTQFESRIKTLKDVETGILEQMDTLRDALDNLLADDGDLADIEAGDDSEQGDFEDQLDELESQAGEVKDRLDKIDEIVGKLPAIRTTLMEAAQPPK